MNFSKKINFFPKDPNFDNIFFHDFNFNYGFNKRLVLRYSYCAGFNKWMPTQCQ